MPVKKDEKRALKKPLIVYRIKIICKGGGDLLPNEEDELTYVEDILDSEDFIEVLNGIHAYYTWLYDKYELEDMGKIELWSKKDFRITGRSRGFFNCYGYGETLHL